MCFFPMVIRFDGVKLNGVTLSACSVWYSLLAMIQLLRHVPSPSTTHPTTFVQGHLDELLRLAVSKPTEVLGDRVVRHAKVLEDFMRDLRNPRCGGCRHIPSAPLETARPFDTHVETARVASVKTARVASTHHCFPSDIANALAEKDVKWLELRFPPDYEVQNYARRDTARS